MRNLLTRLGLGKKSLGNKGLGTEGVLLGIIVALSVVLALTTDSFLSVQNLFDLLNNQSVNIIFAVGLVVGRPPSPGAGAEPVDQYEQRRHRAAKP